MNNDNAPINLDNGNNYMKVDADKLEWKLNY